MSSYIGEKPPSIIIFCYCIFYGKTYFPNFKLNNKLCFIYTNFIGEVFFDRMYMEDDIRLINTNFKKNVKFYSSTIKAFTIDNTSFENYLEFDSITFKENLTFSKSRFKDIEFIGSIKRINKNIGFMKKVSFINTKFEGKFDINANYLKDDFSFLDSKFEGGATNKDIFRMIKNNFKNKRNYTEANRFYLYENDQYIKDLCLEKDEKNSHKKIFSWRKSSQNLTKLVPLTLGKLISNHLTNWFLPILWFFGINITRFLLLGQNSVLSIFSNNEFIKYLIFILSLIIDKEFIKHSLNKYYFWTISLKIISLIFIYYMIITFKRIERRS